MMKITTNTTTTMIDSTISLYSLTEFSTSLISTGAFPTQLEQEQEQIQLQPTENNREFYSQF